ncbi:MAG: transglutaminase domain-containing protein [Candidatus Omnitrophica bacterium]|nr:transglutaminase domain-containing protein [Candidatus Omnitrophota bacterium]
MIRDIPMRGKAILPQLALWVLPLLLVSGWAFQSVPHPREIELTYLARLPQIPKDVREIDVWIPLAKTRAEQRILRREIQSPVPYTVEKDPEYGNDILHLILKPTMPQPVEIAIDYHALLLGSDRAAADPPPTSKELPRYLQPQGLLIIDDQICARTEQAVAGKVTLLAKARGIYDYVIGHMMYDKTTPGYGRGDTARACQVGKGNCTDFHSLFISMARAERIPSRFKIGFLIPSEPSGKIPGYHCWAEFYADGKGWVPLDASEAWKHRDRADYYFGAHDPSRFLISMGRDIRLVPTPKNGPANILFYPYVEVDGQPFPGVETEFRFKDLRQEAAAGLLRTPMA